MRDANAYTLFGALREAGAIPVLAGIVRDDPEALKEAVFSYEIQADAFVSSGGCRVGERDVVKAAFFRHGDIDFSKVAMQPGMPQGFGFIEGKPFFGLPGQPGQRVRELRDVRAPRDAEDDGPRRSSGGPRSRRSSRSDVSGPRDKTLFARVVVARGPMAGRPTPTGGAWLEPDLDRRAGERTRDDPARAWAPRRPGAARPVLLFRSSED